VYIPMPRLQFLDLNHQLGDFGILLCNLGLQSTDPFGVGPIVARSQRVVTRALGWTPRFGEL
jgi:hypothetical protein